MAEILYLFPTPLNFIYRRLLIFLFFYVHSGSLLAWPLIQTFSSMILYQAFTAPSATWHSWPSLAGKASLFAALTPVQTSWMEVMVAGEVLWSTPLPLGGFRAHTSQEQMCTHFLAAQMQVCLGRWWCGAPTPVWEGHLTRWPGSHSPETSSTSWRLWAITARARRPCANCFAQLISLNPQPP